jgi:hypothetical protein
LLQAEAASAVAGADPVIVRNAGSIGARDLHLEDFSVSNGGPNLIEDASIMMAFGRRYGLVSSSHSAGPHAMQLTGPARRGCAIIRNKFAHCFDPPKVA